MHPIARDEVEEKAARYDRATRRSLFEDCEFLQPRGFYYTIYASPPNNTFRRCRIAKGLANYFYRTKAARVPSSTA